MSEVTGRLIADLLPNGTVRTVFLQYVGGGNERPLMTKNLDNAEEEFINALGLTPDKALALRAQLERDKMVDTVITVDVEVAATFRNQPLRKD
jgi:hypothetical protein